jgi:hypothetical protein
MRLLDRLVGFLDCSDIYMVGGYRGKGDSWIYDVYVLIFIRTGIDCVFVNFNNSLLITIACELGDKLVYAGTAIEPRNKLI